MSKIKICGLFRAEDIEYVNRARPDYIGFVFAPSRRRVTPALAGEFRRRLAPEISAVGVFIDENPAVIAALFNEGVIQMAQLHGQESPAYMENLRNLAPVPLIKAVHINDATRFPRADYLLFDSSTPGSGRTFDWSQLGQPTQPYFLAGGIGPGNIDDALRLAPYGIDISSGAETGGVKDGAKIAALVQKVRGN